jgi:hypothetical protein
MTASARIQAGSWTAHVVIDLVVASFRHWFFRYAEYKRNGVMAASTEISKENIKGGLEEVSCTGKTTVVL